jgi:hypothetical protein
MSINVLPTTLRTLTSDGRLLFLTRFARLFAYGSLLVILGFYLIGLGHTEAQCGIVQSLTLAGDVVVSLYLTTRADRTASDVDCRLNSHGRRWFSVPVHKKSLLPDSRGGDRRRQSEQS